MLQINQPNPIVSLIPLVLLTIPMIFVVNKLSKEKGKNVVLLTVLSCIPLVNIIGTPNKRLDDKMNIILEALEKIESKKDNI